MIYAFSYPLRKFDFFAFKAIYNCIKQNGGGRARKSCQ